MKKGSVFLLMVITILISIGMSFIVVRKISNRKIELEKSTYSVNVGNIYTNIKDSQRIAVVGIVIEMREDKDMINKVENKLYVIRDITNKCIVSKDIKQLRNEDEISKIKEEIREEITEELGLNNINIYFSDFFIS